MTFPDDPAITQLVELARREDLGCGDVTTSLVGDPEAPAAFDLVAKEPGVFAGREIAPIVLRAYHQAIEVKWNEPGQDSAAIDGVPAVLATLRGPLGSILSAERVLLNFLQRLCGVATMTRAFVEAVRGTQAAIYDTRKTLPGWRTLDRYAVRCGGGHNHRQGLFDAVLIKDNHLAGVSQERVSPFVFDMLNRLRRKGGQPAFVEVEAHSLVVFRALLSVVGVDLILLDNFQPEEMKEAVRLLDQLGLRGKVALEASGGITLANVRAVAETGVERISVGAITHSARALDLSLERV